MSSPQAQQILEAQKNRFDDAYRDIIATVECLQTNPDNTERQDSCILEQFQSGNNRVTR